MEYSISYEAGKGTETINQLQQEQALIDKNGQARGMSSLKEGQQVTGVVVSVKDQVTLDFDGLKIEAAKDMMMDAVPGDVKAFEVVKVTNKVIELKLMGDSKSGNPISSPGVIRFDIDNSVYMAKKESSGNTVKQEKALKETFDKIEEIVTKLTGNDVRKIEEEGIPIDKLTIDGLYSAIKRIKEGRNLSEDDTKAQQGAKAQESKLPKDKSLPEGNVNIQNKGKLQSSGKEGMKAQSSPQSNAKQTAIGSKEVEQRLSQENLPVTSENVQSITTALQQSDTINNVDDKTAKYLIQNELEPTIGNIYKAYYSQSNRKTEASKPLDEKAWRELKPQAEAVIKEAGYAVNDRSLDIAKWLIENQLPMTKESFTYKAELDDLKANIDKNQVMDKIIEGMKNGTAPKDIALLDKAEPTYDHLITDIHSITEDTISYAVKEGSDLTIKNLIKLQNRKPVEINEAADKQEAAKVSIESDETEVTKADRLSSELRTDTDKITRNSTTAGNFGIQGRIGKTVSGQTEEAKASGDAIPDNARNVSRLEEHAKPDTNADSDERDRGEGKSSHPDKLTIETDSMTAEMEAVKTDETPNTDEAITKDSKPTTYEKVNEENTLSLKEVKAKRQMEEIRLKMTTEAAAKLEKKGIHIETERIEKVVDALRKLEDSYYQDVLKEADVEASEENVRTLKDTTLGLEQLKSVPSYVLGTTLPQRSLQSIPSLISEGAKLQAKLTQAGEAYESLMTTPNKEYGDSLQKAFRNMAPMLSEMNIENTTQNQRAVRILSYNQMEISQENIDRVKAYDLEVTSMINNLQPAVTVRMIKEGINPLDMPVGELNQTIDKIKEEQGVSSEEKFSTYLRKLEKENGITKDERKAYIGIYRLLHNIEKTDGAAIGTLVKTGREITLNHLLSAVQTYRKGNIDKVIDDDFGTLQSKSFNKETITEQLSAIYPVSGKVTEAAGQNAADDSSNDGKTEYLNKMIKLIKEGLSPEKLEAVQQETQNIDTSSSNPVSQSTPILSSDQGVWDSIKDIPIEKLFEHLRSKEDADIKNDEVYTQKQQELREVLKNADQAVRFLNDFKIPCTPAHILQINQILCHGESSLKKLLKQQKENIVENSEISLKKISELSDKLIDKTSMNEAYEDLNQGAKADLNKSYIEGPIDTQTLNDRKNIAVQLSLLKTLAGKEFYQIPIETEDGITNMNLTILHKSETSGKVSAVIQSDKLGTVKADFILKDHKLKGFIRCDDQNGLKNIQKNITELEKTAAEDGITITQLDFGMQMKGHEVYNYQNPNEGAGSASMKSETERDMYRIAKAMVLTVRAAERTESEGNRIAS